MIEVNFGLLDELNSRNVLSAKEVENIETQSAFEKRVMQLLDYVLDKPSEKHEQFLAALNANQQSHVVNYIQAIKDKHNRTKHKWPLWTTRTATKINRDMSQLKEIIDCRCGLLDKMLSEKCITLQQKLFIEAGETDEETNGRLLSLLLRQSVRVYDKFIETLVDTNQHTVAFLLAPGHCGNNPPISDEQRSRLLWNWKVLEELISEHEGYDSMIARLYSVSFLTFHQRKFVESAASRAACVTRLLKILRRGTASNFAKFVQCLKKTKQQQVGRILSEDGVVALIEMTSNSSHNVSKGVVELLRLSVEERRHRYGEGVNQVLDELRKGMCEMICACGQECLLLFFFCSSSAGSHHLRDLFTSGRLKTIVNDIIGALSTDSQTEPWQVDSFEWKDSNYCQCIDYFNPACHSNTLVPLPDPSKSSGVSEKEGAERSYRPNVLQSNVGPSQSGTMDSKLYLGVNDRNSNSDAIIQSKSVYAFNVGDRIEKFRDQ